MRSLAVLLLCFAASAATAQTVRPTPSTPEKNDDVCLAMSDAVGDIAAGIGEIDNAVTPGERAAQQGGAPSAAGATSTIVDSPSFTRIVALAFENKVIERASNKLTLNLSLFAFKALVDKQNEILQEKYATKSNDFLRRLGGSITLGGAGEALDPDGDGTAAKAKEAEDLRDVVTSEIRYRFFGTRDRRDNASLQSFNGELEKWREEYIDALNEAGRTALTLVELHDGLHPGSALMILSRTGRCVPKTKLAALSELLKTPPERLALWIANRTNQELKEFASGLTDERIVAIRTGNGDVSRILERLSSAATRYTEARKLAVRKIDRAPIWSGVVNVTRQGPDFGPNRFGLGLRGLAGIGAWDHTVNIDWQRADWRGNLPIAKTGKLAYSASRLLTDDPGAKSATKLTFSFAGEKYSNVPGAKHKKVFKAGLRLDIPFAENVTVPISLNYASHKDLLTKQKLLSAHVGFSWDFSALGRKKEAGS